MKYKRIANQAQYEKYANSHEELSYKDYNLHKDEIELIQVLLDEYEQRVNLHSTEMNPVETLQYLMDENAMTKSDLARTLKISRQLMTDILNYRRNISKQMVMKLSTHFKLAPLAFSRAYDLKIVKQSA